MLKKVLKNIVIFTFCAAIVAVAPMETRADEKSPGYQTSTSMIVRVEDELVDIHAAPDAKSEVIGQASKGTTYEILEMTDGQWAKVLIGEKEGYLDTVSVATTMAETVEETVVDTSAMLRMEIVEYGKQFLGKPYVWGGTDPHVGVDCSGFTSYIMRQVAGVNLSHSSRAQAGEGRRISAEEMRPGDLVFYGSGRSINHVAIYIGDGQVVHASTERTGVKISPWTYRNPVAIVNVLGD